MTTAGRSQQAISFLHAPPTAGSFRSSQAERCVGQNVSSSRGRHGVYNNEMPFVCGSPPPVSAMTCRSRALTNWDGKS